MYEFQKSANHRVAMSNEKLMRIFDFLYQYTGVFFLSEPPSDWWGDSTCSACIGVQDICVFYMFTHTHTHTNTHTGTNTDTNTHPFQSIPRFVNNNTQTSYTLFQSKLIWVMHFCQTLSADLIKRRRKRKRECKYMKKKKRKKEWYSGGKSKKPSKFHNKTE